MFILMYFVFSNVCLLQLMYYQGFVLGEELCLNPYLAWLANEICWLAVEVLSPCRK